MKLRASLAALLGLMVAAASAAPPSDGPSPTETPPLQLSPLRIVGQPLTCWLALRILAQPGTKTIERILVEEVTPDSDADLRGIRPGDEILQVDGRSVRAMVAGFEPQSDLGRHFINRRRGARVVLEIRHAGATKSHGVTLTQGLANASPWHPSEWP